MARGRARCAESLDGFSPSLQGSKQGEGEGQEEAGLTIPQSVLLRADQVIQQSCSTDAVGFCGRHSDAPEFAAGLVQRAFTHRCMEGLRDSKSAASASWIKTSALSFGS